MNPQVKEEQLDVPVANVIVKEEEVDLEVEVAPPAINLEQMTFRLPDDVYAKILNSCATIEEVHRKTYEAWMFEVQEGARMEGREFPHPSTFLPGFNTFNHDMGFGGDAEQVRPVPLNEAPKYKKEWICLVCRKKAGNGTLQCIRCLEWSHFSCIGMRFRKDQVYHYKCEECKNGNEDN